MLPNGSQLWPKQQMTMPNALCKRNMRNLFKSQVDNNATRPTWHLPSQEAETGCDHGIGICSPRCYAIWIWHTDDSCSSYGPESYCSRFGLFALMMRAHCAHLTFGLLISLACGQARPGQGTARQGQGQAQPNAAAIFYKWIIFVLHTKKIKGKVKKQRPQKDLPQSSVHIFVAQLAF